MNLNKEIANALERVREVEILCHPLMAFLSSYVLQ